MFVHCVDYTSFFKLEIEMDAGYQWEWMNWDVNRMSRLLIGYGNGNSWPLPWNAWGNGKRIAVC